MLDIKLIRENLDAVKKAMQNRGQDINFDPLLGLDVERRAIITETESLRLKRNTGSEEIGKFKKAGQEPADELLKEMDSIRLTIQEKEKHLLSVENQIEDFLLRIPNICDESVPLGKSADENVVVKTAGNPPNLNFKPLAHWEIGEKLGILDFEAAAKISGARFSVVKGKGCALERAIISYFIDTHKQAGYEEVMAPYLVSAKSMTGTGQLPKFSEDAFKCAVDDLYLIPTAEVSVTNIFRDGVLEESALPVSYVSYSACFRREAGSYGKDTKGLIRNHQFNKVELVKFANPQNSNAELEALTQNACAVLDGLGLAYRVMALCTGDIGFGAAKTYDIEVYMASEGVYREISSCSNFTDFQSRRMNIKYKSQETKKRALLHTLNGSGVAVGRTFAAILENFQTADGAVIIPEVLRKYTGFDIIESNS